jgi:glycosyltransferase involved in cell wall biosynthesis
MRIAFFSWESLHSVAVGGIANHVTELAAALERRGHEVHVFVRQGEGQEKYSVHDGVHYHKVPIDIHPDFVCEMNNMGNSMAWHMVECEAKMGAPFDIVHAHDWMCAKGLIQAKNDHGRKAVFTLHSTEFGRAGNVNHDGPTARIRALEAEGAFVADRVIAVSGPLADEVKAQYQVPDWKLRVVRNGIQTSRFDFDVDVEAMRIKYGIGPMDPTVLFVGRLCWQKGPDLLLEAVPMVLNHRRDAKFIFIGDGHMRWDLDRRMHQLGVAHAVRFLGSKSGKEVLNLFKSTDLVCVPSRNEPFGIVILEAWAAGKPVVATYNGGPRETITHNQNGLLVYDHPGSIAWGICNTFDNFMHANWMGQQGKETAERDYSWDALAAQTEGVYGELVSHEYASEPMRRREQEAQSKRMDVQDRKSSLEVERESVTLPRAEVISPSTLVAAQSTSGKDSSRPLKPSAEIKKGEATGAPKTTRRGRRKVARSSSIQPSL